MRLKGATRTALTVLTVRINMFGHRLVDRDEEAIYCRFNIVEHIKGLFRTGRLALDGNSVFREVMGGARFPKSRFDFYTLASHRF